jgi:hypothetical protein
MILSPAVTPCAKHSDNARRDKGAVWLSTTDASNAQPYCNLEWSINLVDARHDT